MKDEYYYADNPGFLGLTILQRLYSLRHAVKKSKQRIVIMETKRTPLYYYGTELNRAGHYYWQLQGPDIFRGRMEASSCPFNPEFLPHKENGQGYTNGAARFYQFAGFSIWAIEGSCADTRPGSRSVFFIERLIEAEELKALVLATPIAKQIIDKMAFAVRW